MKRLLRTLLAVVLLLAGLALAALGGLGITVFGTDGATAAAPAPVTSSADAAALVADLSNVEVGVPLAEWIGTATLTVSSPAGTSMFVGTADQAAVDTFLFGVPYDLASRNGSWTTTEVPGLATAPADPREQPFWIEQSVGPAATIDLGVGPVPQTLVIMNADGAAGVAAELTPGFRGERIFPISAASAVGGLILVVIAVALLARRPRRSSGADVVDLSAPAPAQAPQVGLADLMSDAPAGGDSGAEPGRPAGDGPA